MWFGVTLDVRSVGVAGLGRAFGRVRLTGRRVAEQQVRWKGRDMHGTSGLPGVHRSGRKGVVPRVVRGLGSEVARQCVSRDRDPRPVVVERVVADLATTRRRAGGAGVVWLWQAQWLR